MSASGCSSDRRCICRSRGFPFPLRPLHDLRHILICLRGPACMPLVGGGAGPGGPAAGSCSLPSLGTIFADALGLLSGASGVFVLASGALGWSSQWCRRGRLGLAAMQVLVHWPHWCHLHWNRLQVQQNMLMNADMPFSGCKSSEMCSGLLYVEHCCRDHSRTAQL